MAGLTKCPDCDKVVKQDNRPGEHYVTYTAPCPECVNRKYQKRMDDMRAETRRQEEADKEMKRQHKEGWEKLEADRERRKFQESVLGALGSGGGGGAEVAAATGGCASIISGCTGLILAAFFFFTMACCCCGLGNSNDSKDDQQKDVNEEFEEFKAEQEKDAYKELEEVRVK